VGTVKVDYFGGTVNVTNSSVVQCVMSDGHLCVGAVKYPTKGGMITVAPDILIYRLLLEGNTQTERIGYKK
jgi:hypothetical protein